MANKRTLDDILNDGAIIALILTGAFFIAAYSKQVGYCNYYNIPNSLILVNGNSIAEWFEEFGLFFLLIASGESFIARLLQPVFDSYPSEVWDEQSSNYFFFIFIVFFGVIQIALETGIVLICIWFGMALIPLCFFIVTHLKFKKGTLSIKSTAANTNINSDPSRYSIIKILLGKRLIPILGFSVLLIVFANATGKNSGEHQSLFYAINSRTDIIGIQIYGDYLIAKKIDDKTLSYTEVISLSNGVVLELVENEEFVEIVRAYNEAKNTNQDKKVELEKDEQQSSDSFEEKDMWPEEGEYEQTDSSFLVETNEGN